MSNNTKELIVDSAISLFNTKGFSGTSIRDIANKAKVNVSTISYYFENKHGLLEHCLTTFFEEYLNEIERGLTSLKEGAVPCLKQVTKNILRYQCKNIQLTRFVLREMSIDSQVVREIMSTYFVKERFYFRKVFEEGMRTHEFASFSVNYTILQYKGLLAMPYLNTYYLSEVLHVFPHEPYFTERYAKEINSWVEGILCNQTPEQFLPLVAK